jgi:hypothetical protein
MSAPSVRGHADVDELLERPIAADHADGTELGVDEFNRRVHDSPEDRGKVEILDHRAIGPKQSAEALWDS